jgi:hypothetical protein
MSQDQDLIQFQATHHDHLGKPLKVDGVLGPRTQWALAIDSLPAERKKAVLSAIECIGIKEYPMGSNRGSDIDFWLKRCGVPIPADKTTPAPGNAWCAAFVSWVLSNASTVLRKLARVYDWVHKSGLKQVTIEQVQPGDLGCILRDDGTGHIWLVIGKQMGDKGWVTMQVEGNTSNEVRCTLRGHTLRTMYLQTFGTTATAGIIGDVPFAGSSTT